MKNIKNRVYNQPHTGIDRENFVGPERTSKEMVMGRVGKGFIKGRVNHCAAVGGLTDLE